MSDRDDDLIGAYVLDALSPIERKRFEKHMRSSESARLEAIELADTAVLLGLAVPPVAPSDDLKARLLAEIDRTPQLAPLERAETADESDAAREHVGRHAAAMPADGGERLAPVTRMRPARRALVGVASVAAASGLLLGGVAIGQTAFSQQQQSSQSAQFTELLGAADLVATTSAVGGSDASATLYYSAELERSALSFAGLEDPAEGSVYELWYISDGASSAGLYTPSEEGAYRVLEGEAPQGAVVGVTVEPSGGSDAPTSDPILLAPLGA
jgi:anti-sigma-K factor RskA